MGAWVLEQDTIVIIDLVFVGRIVIVVDSIEVGAMFLIWWIDEAQKSRCICVVHSVDISEVYRLQLSKIE